MHTIDWVIVGLYMAATLSVGLWLSRRASKNIVEFFVGGRSLPWWLAGTSMAATTFSIDTPLYVAGVVGTRGIAGNWEWWAYGFAHVIMIYIFARLWRRAEIVTDNELTEIRYGGRPAATLRAVKGFLFAVVIGSIGTGYAMLAMVKVVDALGVFPSLGLDLGETGKLWAILAVSALVLVYAGVAGLWGVVATDFFQFFLALAGAIIVAVYAVSHVGGLGAMQEQAQALTQFDVLAFTPFTFGEGGAFGLIGWSKAAGISAATFFAYVTILWWSFRRSDGGGEFIQRLSAVQSEQDAEKAAWFFNIMHYVVRTWPWIIVAVVALVVYPDMQDRELGYPRLMLDFLPVGVLGLVVASLLAAFMSTVSTLINWSASYMTNDLYGRFVRPAASQKELVLAARVASVLVTAIAGFTAFHASSIATVYRLILAVGTGPGLVLILRWFWWRVNAWAELSAMLAGFIVGLLTSVNNPVFNLRIDDFGVRLMVTTAISLAVWLPDMLLTKPESDAQLDAFYRRVRPVGPGWRVQRERTGLAPAQDLGRDIRRVGAAMLILFGLLFAIGSLLFGQWTKALVLLAMSAAGFLWIRRISVKPVTIACALALVAAGCGTSGGPPPRSPALAPPTPGESPSTELPIVPFSDGPLRIDVVYPLADAPVAAPDSTFIFGSTGSGNARLTINGAPVPVALNGAFLAFLPVPTDGVYRIAATRDGETVRSEHHVRGPVALAGPATGARIAAGSIRPDVPLVLPRGEWVDISFVGAAGGRARVRLPDGATVEMREQPVRTGATVEAADFSVSLAAGGTLQGMARYSAAVAAQAWAPTDTSRAQPALASALRSPAGPRPAPASVELVIGNDTSRALLPAPLVLLPTDRPVTATVQPPDGAPHDWTARGRPGLGGPFHWFFPPGTRLRVDGERGSQLRVRLAGDVSAWIMAADVRIDAPGSPVPRAGISGVRSTPDSAHIDVRIAMTERLPFRVDAQAQAIDIEVYGATSEVNFLQYGRLDPFIERVAWSQPADDVFRVRVDVRQPVWGWLAFYDETGSLVVRVRRPPPIDADRPLAGIRVAVDPGHPPGGATGPTRFTEAEANLGIALELRPLLERAGATVLLTRTDASPVELGSRPRTATEWNAHLLVSVHNNAFPDGVNPFVNSGTSVYYYQPQSVELAAAVQRALLEALGTRDIGIGRADLAVVRPTWMPAILSETLFLMIPRQEAALRDPAVQAAIARAHLAGIQAFLRARAGRGAAR